MSDLVYKDEAYCIIGVCMEVHNQLGHGFSEIVYKDAIATEFDSRNMVFEREKMYPVFYKGILLPHHFCADFVVYGKIILELKCVKVLTDEHISQAINYLKVSQNKLALLINFGRRALEYKRIIY